MMITCFIEGLLGLHLVYRVLVVLLLFEPAFLDIGDALIFNVFDFRFFSHHLCRTQIVLNWRQRLYLLLLFELVFPDYDGGELVLIGFII